MDAFFGDERATQELNKSFVQVNFLSILDKRGNATYDANLHVNLSLPNTEKRLTFVLESEASPEQATTPATTPADVVENRERAAAMRLIFAQSKLWNLHSDAGVRVRLEPDIFARVRARRSFFFPAGEIRAAQTVAWFAMDGVAATTTLDFEHAANGYLFRATSTADWKEANDKTDLSQYLRLYHSLDSSRALAFSTGVVGDTPSPRIQAYKLDAVLRKKVYRNWLFYNLTAAAEFPRSASFTFTPSIGFAIEILFGGG